ncbi:hypothetical protein [Flavobacterium psychrophilum]|nr:hypothetical protein [Flavobacterium psychrophilum]AIJ37113.1 hypothetical protein FPSM_00618 [Flavobacterium psychrophilum]EKT3958453.1 hypothetical protein [Flavobacterium psychrophilum]EKT4510546.1 hypothetical protein [Flavobacterium psychrophilum]EKT4535410.1 hypothetical protein [Flavobacterium psychrophilum]EKT4548192.1 hypothetical protein [Flavobacterium psychrophilum]
MENKIKETEDNFHEIVNETIEKLKGKNYATAMAILEHIKRDIEYSLTLN